MDYVHNPLEMAKIIGEPRDPRKPYSNFVEKICLVDTAKASEYTYSYDALVDVNKVYLIASSGEITQENVTPDTPAIMSFVDVATPEYWCQLKDLMSAKENTLARKNRSINRGMNAYESKYLIDLMAAGCSSTGNEETLESGQTKFRYSNMINMIENVVDYGADLKFLTGTTVHKDIKLWDFDENKYSNLAEALKALQIEIIRVRQPLTLDGASVTALSASKAYLVAVETEMQQPLVMVRKEIGTITDLPGVTTVAPVGPTAPQRAVFVGSNLQTIPGTGKRYLGVSVTGYGQFAAVLRNMYAVAQFERV